MAISWQRGLRFVQGDQAFCGSAAADGQLCIVQSVYSNVPLCGTRLAASAGTAHISREGITPLAWLNRFGRSVNRGASGSPDVPLPLHGPEPYTYRCIAPLAQLLPPDARAPPRWWSSAALVLGGE
jgi:hypothetical protein